MRGDISKADSIPADAQAEAVSVEKQQELLLMNKLASSGKLPPKSAGSFLQKRLQQRKFFDSGDYNMNKDKKTTTAVVGQQQPVPATVVSQAPPISVAVAPKLAATIEENLPKHHQQDELMPTIRPPAGSFSGCSMDAGDEDTDEHLQIPRPDTVPQRKSSILHPSAHSKLSPQPHIHHEHTDESLSMPPQ
uniref:Uncharacterized protein n=2 Tax=Meloidogyne TaxID=189290 RepID=A0A914KL35_MELIC